MRIFDLLHNELRPRFFVTGVQRSGTRFVAKTLANEISYEYVDEKDFDTEDIEKFANLSERTNIVVHCPAIARWIHEYVGTDDHVVWVKRLKLDTVQSMNKIGSSHFIKEFDAYNLNIINSGFLWEAKNDYWKKQKEFLSYTEINYEDLKKLGTWVPKHKRLNFTKEQTE